jgi:tellurite methyltransferase
MKNNNPYDSLYNSDDFYWGKTHSKMCQLLLETWKPEAGQTVRLLDLGCGEGQNLVWLAGAGFTVTGLDVSIPGLEKAKVLAEKMGVSVTTIHGDLLEYRLEQEYEVLFSTGALHYLPSDIRQQRFEHLREHTSPNGVHALSLFVEKPFIEPAPDAEDSAFLYHSGELMGYYHDWEILFSTEEIFNCNSSGIPHRHAVNRLVARKVSPVSEGL